MNRHKSTLVSASLCFSVGIASAATPDRPPEPVPDAIQAERLWTVHGGEFRMRFNCDLLDLYGIGIEQPASSCGRPSDVEFSIFGIGSAGGLQFNAPAGSFDRFVGGAVQVRGAFVLTLPDGERLELSDFLLRVRRSNPMQLELVGADGQAWLYVNHLMHTFADDYSAFFVRSADLSMTPALAERVHAPELADAYIGEIKLRTDVAKRASGSIAPTGGDDGPNFHGFPVPGGGIYQADVRMETFSMSFSRCRRADTGANGCDQTGPDDGEVVFTPSSTLRNSAAVNTADIPWYEKFTGDTNSFGYPYPNADQHPYLIWNIYRIVDDQLEQIGASGLKHAFLTTNIGCATGAFASNLHILGRGCSDTYGTGNNDSPLDLGPRRELIPASGFWGRCGSIFDANCDGVENASGNGSYDSRLIVRESQLLAPPVNALQFFAESWYIVQDDIDIYNTMAHRSMAPAPSGAGWTSGSQGPLTLGPLINLWVNPLTSPARNIEIATGEGHARVAVKVKMLANCPAGSGLGGTCFRYDYAVHNFDFARAVFGTAPNDQPPNLRVTSNNGFASFTVPVGGAAVFVERARDFADADIDAGNDWTATVGVEGVTWTAPAGNSLNWGHLYRFTLVANAAADDTRTGQVILGVEGAGSPSSLTGTMMVPGDAEATRTRSPGD